MSDRPSSKVAGRGVRPGTGSTLAEMPAALWMCLVCIAVPLIVLAGITLRFNLFRNAVREAIAAFASTGGW